MARVDPRSFWDNKILGWEDGRYGRSGARNGLLERIADRSSRSLRFRLEVTRQLLEPHLAGQRIVELGCGSGLLAPALLAMGARSYLGYDLSPVAIEHARRRAAERQLGDQARFEVCAVEALPPLDADIVVSLGLLDWLDDAALETVLRAGGNAHYLHAIAERRRSPAQWIHRAYVFVAYGYRSGGYRPRYYRVDDLRALVRQCDARPFDVYRDPRLSFGALLTSLPIEPGT